MAHSRLEPGEELLWSGMPRQGLLLRPSDCFAIPFTLMWAGFAFYYETMVVIVGASLLSVLWGIPFVLVGTYITAGRFVVDAHLRSRTAYALTNRRVLFVREGLGASVCSRPLDALSEITLRCRPDGVGSITLRPTAPPWWLSGAWWPGYRRGSFGPPFGSILEGCPDAERVHSLLLSAREARRAPPPGSR